MANVKSNLKYSTIYQIVAILTPLLISPYIARILGAEGIGKYAYAYSVAYYVSLFIKLGVENYGNRLIATVRGNFVELSTEFWGVFVLQLFCGCICSIVYLIYSFFVAEDRILALIMYGVLLSNSIDVTWFFYGLEEIKSIVFRDILLKLVSTLLILYFVREGSDIWIYSTIMSLGFLVTQVVLWPQLLKKVKFTRVRVENIVKHIKPNIVLFVPVIAISIYKIMDKIMLGIMSTKTEVGYYESSEKIVKVPMAFIIALGTVMLPHMSNIITKGKFSTNKVNDIIIKSEQFVIALSSLLAFGIMAVAKEFVPLFYGEGFEKCVYLYYLLLPSCIFLAFANVIRTQCLLPMQKDKEYIISLFVGALVNLIVNLLAIPKLHSIGAAIGTLAAEFSVCIAQTVTVIKIIPIKEILNKTLGYIVVSVGMFIIGLSFGIEKSLGMLSMKIVFLGLYWTIASFFYFVIVNRLTIREAINELIYIKKGGC